MQEHSAARIHTEGAAALGDRHLCWEPWLMGVPVEGSASQEEGGWTIEEAERLLNSLTGVLSARMVASPGERIDEIHLLTTEDVAAKRTVRNVESALLAHLGLTVDHRKISVAQTSATPSTEEGEDGDNAIARFVERTSTGGREPRLLFIGHQLESDRPQRVRARVTIEWQDERVVGEAMGTDLPRARLEVLANAVLQAVETLLDLVGGDDVMNGVALSLDGVKVVQAFDRRYVLVGVHALQGRNVTVLSGSAPADTALEGSVIMATLQATDRWVRGRL